MVDITIPNRDWSGSLSNGRKKNVNDKQKHPINDFSEKKGPGKLRQMQRSYKKGGKV